MRAGLYPKLAWDGIRKNKRFYLPYILTCIGMVMMFYIIHYLAAMPTIKDMPGGDTMEMVLGLGTWVVALFAVIFLFYTNSFLMLLIFVYILIPTSSLIHVGGFSNFTANLDSSLVKPYIDGNIVGDIVTYLVFTMAGAEMWQRAFSAKDRKSAKKGMFLGTAVYGVTIILVFFMGIVAQQIVGDDILAQYGTTDAAVPALAIKVLPAGLTGLALAGMLSVMMSTADSYLLVSVQTCVRDIGKTVKPEMHEKTEMKLSRIFSIILPIGALIIALYMQNAYNILMFSWSFYAAAAGIPAFAALYWKKATKSGIIAGMIGGFVVCVGWKLLGQPFGLGAALPGTIACAVALICVSLITCKKQPSVYLESAPQL